MTRDDFKPIVHTIKNAYGERFKVTQSVFDTWYEMLCDLDIAVLKLAVRDAVCQSPYVPTIAEIRKAYESQNDRAKQSTTEIKETYEIMTGLFSGGGTEESWTAYTELLGMAKDKLKAARWISKVAHERGESGDFTEFMVGLLNEQRSRS